MAEFPCVNLRYAIDPEARLVTLVYSGQPEVDEWRQVVAAVLVDPAYQPDFGFLADRRAVSAAPSSTAIREVVDFLSSHRREIRGRWAAVVSGPATFGMARMTAGLLGSAGPNLRTFTDVELARRWVQEGDEALQDPPGLAGLI
jgi:hypothetical protein